MNKLFTQLHGFTIYRSAARGNLRPALLLFPALVLLMLLQAWTFHKNPIKKAAPAHTVTSFAACPNPVEVGAWNRLTAAQRTVLKNGGTVQNFNLGVCNGGPAITANITSGPAPDAPTPGTLNSRHPRRWGNASFFLARQNMNTAGVQYCFNFSTAVGFTMDSREHAYFANHENIRVSATNGGVPVNLTGSYQTSPQGALISGSGTPEVHFNANGRTEGGLWWEVNSGLATVTQVCIQYYSTSAGDPASVEPFRLNLCGVKCVADDPITCDTSQFVSRWNRLTTSQRTALDAGQSVYGFNTGFCDETGDAIRFIEIGAGPAVNSWNFTLNNMEPRPYGRYSFDNGRSMTGLGGNTYCFTLDEARPIRLNSKEHSHFINDEYVRVKAYLGADPVTLSGYLRMFVDSIPVAGGPTGIFFAGSGIQHGTWWYASSGTQPVSKVCVEYYQFGANFSLDREPFAIEICADRCLYDDLHACSQNPQGAPGCNGLPFLFITKTVTSPNNYGLNTCTNASGQVENPVLEFTITMDNAGGALKELFLIEDLQSYLAPSYVYINSVPEIIFSTASGNPLINPQFNGANHTNIFLPNTGFLQYNQVITVRFRVELNPNAPGALPAYVNTAWGGGMGNGGGVGNDLSGGGAGGFGHPTPVKVLPPGVVGIPAQNVTLEATLPNYMTGLQDWLANKGGASFQVPGCGPVTWTNNYNPANWVFGCGQITGSIDVTFTASDSCGFVFTTCATFTLEDTQGPDCVKPQDLTLDCGNPNAAQILNHWLNYTGPWTELSQPVTFTNDFTGLGGASCTGAPIIVTWTATDACGNSTLFSAKLTVVDNQPPVLASVPADITLDLCEMPPPPANVTATDACDPNVTVVFDETTSGSDCIFVTTRTWTATDDCGNSVSASQIITYTDEQPPVFSNVPPNITAECPDVPPITEPDVEDCTSVTVVFSEIQIGGACPLPNQLIRTWTATDACGNSSSVTQTVIMNPPNVISEIIFSFVPPDVTATCDENPMFGDPVVETTCPAGGLSVSFSDVVNTNGDCSEPFSITRTWIAHDNCGNMEIASQTINTGPDTQAPVFAADTPADITLDCADALYQPVAWDNCGPTFLSYEDSGKTGDCTTGFQFTRTWTATDFCGNASSFVQNITTTPDTTPPVFIFVPYDQFFDCDDDITFPDPVAFDNCGNVTITWQDSLIGTGDCNEVNGVIYGYDIIRTWIATDDCGNITTAVTSAWVLPGFNTGNLIAFAYVPESKTVGCGSNVVFGEPVCHSACGDLTLTFTDHVEEDCASGNTHTRTWTATDVCGNTTTASQTITVEPDHTPPAFALVPADSYLSCSVGTPVFGTPVVTDNCAEGAAITLTYSDAWLNTGNCDGHSITRTWTATDPCGNASFASQTIFVVDNTPPAFSFVPDDKTIGCGQQVQFGVPVAEDDCSSVVITFEDEMAPAGCEGSYAHTRTWAAVDACGNVSFASQTVTVTDLQPPLFTATADNYSVPCGQPIVFANMTATDACSSMSITYDDVTVTQTCGTTHTRTWTATDACGNMAQTSQTITVTDDVAPMFTSYVQDKTIQCGQPVVFDEIEAADACSSVQITFEDAVHSTSCGSEHYRLWIATDGCGNAAVISQKITVMDTEAPVFTNLPAQLEMSLAEFQQWEAPTAEVTDCHAATVSMSVSSDVSCSSQQHHYTYTAEDACGNVSQHSLTVLLTDVVLGAEMTPPAELDCGGEYVFSVAPTSGAGPYTYAWQVNFGENWSIVAGNGGSEATVAAGTGLAEIAVLVTDANGCTATASATVECASGTTSVKDAAITGFALLPNPVNERLTLRYGARVAGEADIRITDALGRVAILQSAVAVPGTNEQVFDVSALVPGTYFITLQMGGGMRTERFVKL